MLAFDEEVDYLEYQNYLRSQSDAELFDIVGHLDVVNCPRRAEAARREFSRRHFGVIEQYSESENLWRNFALLAILVTVLTLLLSLTMSQDEATAPQPPPSLDLTADGSFFQFSSMNYSSESDGLSTAVLGVYVGQLCQNLLRNGVQLFSRFGGYLILLTATVWKLSLCWRRRTAEDLLSRDVRRLLTVAVAGQIVLLCSGAFTHLPLLASGHEVTGGFLARAVTLIAPWG